MTDNLTAEVKLCRQIGFQTGISFCFAKNRRMAGSVYREAEPNTLSCSVVTARKRKSFGNCINAYAGINAAPVCRPKCAGAIGYDDLNGFSEKLREDVIRITSYNAHGSEKFGGNCDEDKTTDGCYFMSVCSCNVVMNLSGCRSCWRSP